MFHFLCHPVYIHFTTHSHYPVVNLNKNATAYDGTSGAGRLPAGVGLGPMRDGMVGAALAGAPGAGLCGIVGFAAGTDLEPATDLGDGGLSDIQQHYNYHDILSTTITVSTDAAHILT